MSHEEGAAFPLHFAPRHAPPDAARALAMDAAPRHSLPTLVVRFPDVAAANRRVAGVSAAGRWAASAEAAGLTIGVAAPGLRAWTPATADDFGRIGVAATIVAPGTALGATPLLDGRFLADPAAVRLLARGQRVDRTQLIDLADAPRATRLIVQATAKRTDGVVSRWLNRPVSQRISALLLRFAPGVRPSHVTAVVALTGLAMALAFLFGGARGLVVGALLFQLASMLDGVDGELARATFRGSAAGAALDTRVDLVSNIGYLVCVEVALTRLYGGVQPMVGGLAVMFALTGLALIAWLARRMGLHGSLDVLKPYYRRRFPDGWQWWVTELLVMTTSRDFWAFAFGVVIVAGVGWAVSWLLLGFVLAWLTAVVCAVPGVLRQAGGVAVRGISA